MKYIRKFSLFESDIELTKDQKNILDEYTMGVWMLNPTTGLVEIQGSFDLIHKKLKSIPYLRLGRVTGEFNCYHNNLTSLEGSPLEVGGDFSCSNNQLTSLKGAPYEVGGDFYCVGNPLTSLEGAPENIGGYFHFKNGNKLKWTTNGKLEYLKENPKFTSMILPTIPQDSLIKEISESPNFISIIENFDKDLYNKLLKDLGWDKMGPDLLRQLKNGII